MVILFRLLGAAVTALSIALAVGSFGPWAHTGAESLSRSEAGTVSMLPFALWVGLLAQLAVDPKRARHWQPFAAIVVAGVFALLITIDVTRVAGSHVGGHGNLAIGWGLWTSHVLSQALVLFTVAFAISSRGRIALYPWPAWWDVQPEEPLRSAIRVVGLGAALLAAGSFGPWKGSGDSAVSGLDLSGEITLLLAVATAGLAASLYGPPRLTISLRTIVLPLGAAALAVGLVALADLHRAPDAQTQWGIWATIGGGAVTLVGGAMLALVPLPNDTRTGTAPPRWARGVPLSRPARNGPPLPSPPTP